jgi:hypothetical protein
LLAGPRLQHRPISKCQPTTTTITTTTTVHSLVVCYTATLPACIHPTHISHIHLPAAATPFLAQSETPLSSIHDAWEKPLTRRTTTRHPTKKPPRHPHDHDTTLNSEETTKGASWSNCHPTWIQSPARTPRLPPRLHCRHTSRPHCLSVLKSDSGSRFSPRPSGHHPILSWDRLHPFFLRDSRGCIVKLLPILYLIPGSTKRISSSSNNSGLVHIWKVTQRYTGLADTLAAPESSLRLLSIHFLGDTSPCFRDASSRSIASDITICRLPLVLEHKPSLLEAFACLDSASSGYLQTAT